MKDGDDAESSSIEVDVEAPASHEDHVLMPVDLPPPPQSHDAATTFFMICVSVSELTFFCYFQLEFICDL